MAKSDHNHRSFKALKAVGFACLAIPVVVQGQSASQEAHLSDADYQRVTDERIREVVRQELNKREQREAEDRARYVAEANRQQEAETQRLRLARQQEAADNFISTVRRAVEEAWAIPSDAEASDNATVQVQLTEKGHLWKAAIHRTSDDPEFDRSVLEAVEDAAPYFDLSSLPPEKAAGLRQFKLRFIAGDRR